MEFSDEDLLTVVDELPRKRLRFRFGHIPGARPRRTRGQATASVPEGDKRDECEGK